MGGAVAVSLIHFTIEETTMLSFSGNDAKKAGGAIFEFDCITRVKGNTIVTFINNKATTGGAIFILIVLLAEGLH